MTRKLAGKSLNTFPIKSHRKPNYDYGSEGAYFVTVKTLQMKCYFGEIVKTSHGTSPQECDDIIKNLSFTSLNQSQVKIGETCHSTSGLLTEIGLKAKENWLAIPSHFPFVELDEFAIMPNHIHGILFLSPPEKTDWKLNEFKSLPGTLGTIINQFKGSVTRYANLNKIKFGWHPRYHDVIIRNPTELHNIRNYIQNNPQKWLEKYGK